MDEFEHLKISLEEIKRATSNFSGNVIIGSGGFGKVYEGEASHFKGRSIVAIKRLDRKYGQGEPEFWKETMMLSRYTHTNLVSLLGFCDEDGEKILVYEHASNGSLDRHLSSGSLTWAQRIKICLDAAKGLTYLHDHKGTQQRVLHRDIKSANILLDQNWNAKLSDMGLSKLGPANQLHTRIITNVVGTPGYCDPQYMMTYTLAKESDVYSFGVVLFEVLCGRLCFELDSNGDLRVLVSTWKESYKQKKIDKIIFKDLRTPMDMTCLETFVGIAFQCIHESREQRPKISLVKKLQSALRSQEFFEKKESSKYDAEEIIKTVKTRSKHRYLEDIISDGKRFLLNLGKQKRIIKQHPELPLAKSASTSVAGLSEINKLVFLNAGIYNFDSEDLYRASAMVLGKGSVGTSYTAEINSETTVVAKRLKDVMVGKKKFESTMEILGQMINEHLILLRAFYYSKEDKLLVYDYLPAGSLSARLHGSKDPPQTPLDWGDRIKIALSAARGVAYLHDVGKLVHGNIKSSNILLQQEEETYAIVSDFGLNTLFNPNHQVSSYLAPEILKDQELTFESDVYSFGVLLFELLTGKDPKLASFSEDLSGWVQLNTNIQEEWKANVFDVELLKHQNIEQEMVSLLKIAMKCVLAVPKQRPTMHDMVTKIEDMNQDKI